MEFVVLATSTIGKEWGESGDTFGVLGSDLFAEDLKRLINAKEVEFLTSKGGASYGTYVQPCRIFGILDTSSIVDEGPARITPRGRQIYEVRKQKLKNSKLTQFILDGGIINLDDIYKEGLYFSINGLLISDNEEELNLIEEAFFKSYSNESNELYECFKSTVFLALKGTQRKGKNSAVLIRENFKRIVSDTNSTPSKVEIAWFECELLRRVHFAIELLLSSLTETLINLRGGTINEVFDDWEKNLGIPQFLQDLFNTNGLSLQEPLSTFKSRISKDAFLKEPINRKEGQTLSPSSMSLFALALLLACQQQTDPIIRSGKIENKGKAVETAFDI